MTSSPCRLRRWRNRLRGSRQRLRGPRQRARRLRQRLRGLRQRLRSPPHSALRVASALTESASALTVLVINGFVARVSAYARARAIGDGHTRNGALARDVQARVHIAHLEHLIRGERIVRLEKLSVRPAFESP
jgi:hypothetical protein